MYPPTKFADASLKTALDIARKCKFSALSVIWDGNIETVHLPLTPVVESENVTFIGHAVRSNPLLAMIKSEGIAAKAIFQPASGYVSPSVYAEKFETGKVVPTWNYVAAHFEGTVQSCEPEYSLRQILDLQVADYEGSYGGTWQVSDAPEDYIKQMQTAITGFQFTVSGWKSIKKLSQNKSGSKDPIIDWLEASAAPSRDITNWMRWEQVNN